MVNVAELKAAMVRKGYTQKELASKLGMSEKTMYTRLKNECFGSDEIEKMMDILDITDPMPIFFDGRVTCKATNSDK